MGLDHNIAELGEASWKCIAMCMTDTGVCFQCPVAVKATTIDEAIAKVESHLLENGAEIQLSIASPKLPVKVIVARPFDIIKINQVELASRMPTSPRAPGREIQ